MTEDRRRCVGAVLYLPHQPEGLVGVLLTDEQLVVFDYLGQPSKQFDAELVGDDRTVERADVSSFDVYVDQNERTGIAVLGLRAKPTLEPLLGEESTLPQNQLESELRRSVNEEAVRAALAQHVPVFAQVPDPAAASVVAPDAPVPLLSSRTILDGDDDPYVLKLCQLLGIKCKKDP